MKSPRTLVIGTANPDKLKELRALLKDLKIRVVPVTRLKKIPRVVENGRTFAANAAKKARAYSRLSPHLTLADDSGLCVRALRGRPGVYSARFAGPGCTYADNNRKLLRLLSGTPPSQRQAYFVSAIALFRRGRRVKILKGLCHGRIAPRPLGRHGFGYDPVFIPAGSIRTFAELPPRLKNTLSHRARALSAAKRFLKSYLTQSPN